ncbi:MAG TPA: hypothetical protein DIC53_00455 [Synergistaceae bacterium]|jgi:drug/metabolite transporter (DMT)-like permease|nr:hypothetical protein [Synergistaceae bacterium]
MTGVATARLKALCAVILWGGSLPASKIAVSQISFDTLLWLRIGSGFLVLLLYLALKGRLRRLSAMDTAVFAGLGFIGVFLHNAIQAIALETTAAGLSGLITAANPIAIAVLGRVILDEKLNARKKGGILLAAVGVLILLSRGDPAVFLGFRFSSGELLMLTGILTWGLFSVLSRKALKNVDPGLAMSYALAFGLLYSTAVILHTGRYDEIPSITPLAWGNILFLGIFCSGIAYVLWYDALQVLPASEVGVFLYINPVVAVLISAVLLGEPVTVSMLLGGLLIFSGVWFVNRSTERRPGRGSISCKE